MTAHILDGRRCAQAIQDQLALQIQQRHTQQLPAPQLDVILVGDNPASAIYVKHKQAACEKVGIISTCHRLSADSKEEPLAKLINELNQSSQTNGILLQLPLPEQLTGDHLMASISPHKDVDGFHPLNMGKLVLRQPGLRPCTPLGIITLLKQTKVDLMGQHAVIVGASNIVGRPMALELLICGCTVTICHRFTNNLSQHVQQADILIAAIGQPGIIQSDWIKPQSIVIDVGFSRLNNGTISGDIDFATAKQRAAWISPVPGGVGPMTVATLLQNTLQATIAQEQVKK